MSLTSFLSSNSDVKKRFRQEFPKPKLTAMERQTKMLAPPISNRYALIGTAFDYLLRFYLQRTNPTAKQDSWVADLAVKILWKQAAIGRISESVYRKGKSIVTEAKERLSRYLITGQLNEELLESALLLAQLDSIFRQGTGHEQIGIVHDEDLQDLNNLISIAPSNLFKSQQRCLLNPTFGVASEMVGGADADFIIDDLLVDLTSSLPLKVAGIPKPHDLSFCFFPFACASFLGGDLREPASPLREFRNCPLDSCLSGLTFAPQTFTASPAARILRAALISRS